MKKVLVVDWLDAYGGAERVIRSLCSTFHFTACYTLINVMKPHDQAKVFEGNNMPIHETKMKFTGGKFRMLLPLFSYFLGTINIDPEADLIISSSHAVAKGIKKSSPHQVHISYFQARNLKYIWDDASLYFGKAHKIAAPLLKRMRKTDIKAAQRPDYIVSNSKFVQAWVKKTYNRDSEVIYPPVDLAHFSLKEKKEDYYVAVGRIEPYKRFDVVVKAFNTTGKKLVIVGDGSQLPELKRMANDNISFTGFVETKEVNKHISKAKGFVHAGIEDFGIAPIEAQACGTPVIAYGYGGVLETIIENETGIFFSELTSRSLEESIHKFETLSFNPHLIRENAERFSIAQFESQMSNFVALKLKKNYS